MSLAVNFPAFETPQLQQPTPAAARSPAVSFTKGTIFPTSTNTIDLRRLSLSSATSSLPPPYPQHFDEETAVPGYGEQQEVQTMARYLFFYGFLFPPFWILGSLILVTPLTPDPSWHAEKDQKTIENLLSVMRVVERRWAWRCVMALSTLILLILIIVGSVLLAQHFGANP
jgi:hypothetical protein